MNGELYVCPVLGPAWSSPAFAAPITEESSGAEESDAEAAARRLARPKPKNVPAPITLAAKRELNRMRRVESLRGARPDKRLAALPSSNRARTLSEQEAQGYSHLA